MADKPIFKITINGKEYRDLESVPEEFRALIQKQVGETLGQAAPAAPAESEVVEEPGRKVVKKVFKFEKHFNISIGRRPDAASAPSSSPEAAPPPPGPKEESSSGLLWLMLAAATLGTLVAFIAKHHH